jgi:hypothetical protein
VTIARAHLVDPTVSRWYHCITRCVRRAFLLGEGPNDRKVWFESRLQELAEIFEGRFKSIAVLDEAALLATCTYIDLNPVAAGIAEVPESSAHTSIKARVNHVNDQGRTEDLKAARSSSVAGSAAAQGLEEGLWLCPIEDRRRLDSRREGMLEGFSLGNYLLLVDFTARLYREGKATLSPAVAEILDRLGRSVDHWHTRLKTLSQGHPLGRFFATTRQRLRDVVQRLGLRRLPNLGGCPAS